MSTRDLKAKYGEGNTRSIINRAIRAEHEHGGKVLDALTLAVMNKVLDDSQRSLLLRLTEVAVPEVHQLVSQERWSRQLRYEVVDKLQDARADLELVIRRRYEMRTLLF